MVLELPTDYPLASLQLNQLAELDFNQLTPEQKGELDHLIQAAERLRRADKEDDDILKTEVQEEKDNKASDTDTSPMHDGGEAPSPPPFLSAIGRGYARKPSFWAGVLFSGVIQGILLGFVALGFFVAFEALQNATWNSGTYNIALEQYNADAIQMTLTLGQGNWWYVGLLTASGAAVGVIKSLWTLLVRPFPAQPAGFLLEIQNLKSKDPLEALPIAACAILSLGGGPSCGPEMPLSACGAAFGTALSQHTSFLPKFLDMSEQDKLCVLDGMAAAIGPLFPSQYISPMLLHEVGKHWGGSDGFQLMETIARTGIASTISYAIFIGFKNRTILSTIPAPNAAYDEVSTINVVYLFQGAVLGIICGLAGLIGFVMMAIFAKLGDSVCERIDRLGLGVITEQQGDARRTRRTYLGMIATPALGGCLVGLLAVACPLTLGDGSAQLNVILLGAKTLGADTLIVSAIVKMVAVSISIGFGFIGGQVFPFIFAGACIGSTAHLLVPQVPLLIAFPVCFTATPCAFMPLTFTLTTVASVAMALGGPATSPVFIAAICSFTVVCGLGIIQQLAAKAMAKAETASNEGTNA